MSKKWPKWFTAMWRSTPSAESAHAFTPTPASAMSYQKGQHAAVPHCGIFTHKVQAFLGGADLIGGALDIGEVAQINGDELHIGLRVDLAECEDLNSGCKSLLCVPL
jgi:hypothetical protein